MAIYIGNNRYKVMVGSSRADFVSKPALPYDAEIEYIESSGTQYIDIDVIPTTSTVAKIKFMNLVVTGNVIFGFYNGEAGSYRFFNNQSNTYFDIGSTNGRNPNRISTSASRVFVNNIYEIELGNHYVNNITNDYNISGEVYDKTFEASLTLNYGGTNKISRNRWYYVQVYDGTTLLRDMIPVRVGTTGYMYDRVSNQLFSNDGTGDFTLGPDKT
jgi:hypothetical protein